MRDLSTLEAAALKEKIVDFLFVCTGRDRYVNRYRQSNGVGKQTKRDARHRRLIKIKQDEDITLAELLPNTHDFRKIIRTTY